MLDERRRRPIAKEIQGFNDAHISNELWMNESVFNEKNKNNNQRKFRLHCYVLG